MKLRLSTIASLICAAGAGFLLFQTSQNVQDAERNLRQAQASLAKEQEAMRVLEAEWDYLNRPDRIEELARQHLKMHAPTLDTLVSDSNGVPKSGAPVLPQRKPQMKAMPAVMKEAKIETPAEPSPLMPAPLANAPGQQFNDLLNELTGQEPAVGGTP